MRFEKRKARKIGVSVLLVVTIGVIMFIANLSNMIYQRCDSSQPNGTRTDFSYRSQFRSGETTVQCIGPTYNQSCLYQNLYYSNGTFWALSLKDSNLSLPGVRLEALATTEFRPRHLVFDSDEDLHRFVHFTMNPIVFPGLTLHFNQRWHGNIGHALFDGLYPAYVALIRFAPAHQQPFRAFVGFDRQNCDNYFSEGIYSRFAGLGMIKSGVADLLVWGRWLAFEKLIMGGARRIRRRTIRRGQFVADNSSRGQFVARQFVAGQFVANM